MSNITEWGYSKIGFDINYTYYIGDKEREYYVSSDELLDFIEDKGLADVQTDVDTFSRGNIWNYYVDNINSVAEQYFNEYLINIL